MAYPMNYSFYGTTIPTLRLIAQSAINVLNTAQAEASNGKRPSETDVLDARFGEMLPFRYQPIFLSKFPLVALKNLQLHGSTPMPSLDPSSFTSFDSIKDFFTQCIAMYDAVDEKAFNESADKSVDIPFESMGKTVKMTGLADYYHCFVLPNAWFHLNAMYMLLRSQGFELGKTSYIGAFFSQSQAQDWKALKG
jgi:hypothetical protein